MFNVAVVDAPPVSVTLTTKMLGPTSPESGVPERTPPLETLSQTGPLTFANVNASLLRSLAFVEMLAEYATPAITSGSANGSALNVGGQFGTRLMEVTNT